MRHALSELLLGKRAHTNSLHCIDVSAEVAGERPSPLPHSIFELVWHMNFWMSHELERISGSPLPYPEHASLGWPTTPTPGLEEWRRAQDDFRGSVGKLQDLAAADPSERERVVLNSSSLEGTRQYTVEEIVGQTAVHNAYHLGQVALVRRALDEWPPKEGSDTW